MIRLLSIIGLLCLLVSCNAELKKTTSEEFKQTISGEAQGTTWSIVYYDLQERNFKPQIDSILKRIDQSVSTYLKGSLIDRWNASDSGEYIDDLFLDVLMQSWEVHELTEGAFDPTVKPLVSYWGFGPERITHPETVDSNVIDSLLTLVAFDTLELSDNRAKVKIKDFEWGRNQVADSIFLYKPIAGIQLDFNAIAQGWSADKIAAFLMKNGIQIYFVEIGGEIVAGFPKPHGELWRFGIDKPSEDLANRELESIIKLRNKGLATSGNYRKFYEIDGVKYAHTIDPTTGYPAKNQLLSATVVNRRAAKADALATSFMVMGTDSAIQFLNMNAYLNTYVYLITSIDSINYDVFMSKPLKPLIEELD